MKTSVLFLSVVTLCCFSSFAQVRDNPEDAFDQKAFVGLNYGATLIIGHLEKHPLSTCYSFNYGQNKNQNICVGFEAAFGTLSSNTPHNSWTSGLVSVNNFTAVNINARYNFNNIFKSRENRNKETTNRIYWGFGLGVINNNLSTLTEKYRPEQSYLIKNIKTNSLTGVALENIGLDCKLPHSQIFHNTVLNFNFQTNYAFSAYVDGYPFAKGGNQFNDIYFLLTAGLHFYFGEMGSMW